MFHGWLTPSLRLLFGKAFALFLLVFVGFLQPRRSSGRNLSISVYIVFVSKAIICNLPSLTNPREPILLKTYIAEACAAFLLPGKLCQQHIQWLRRWAPSKRQTECIRDQISTTSARQLRLPCASPGSEQPGISNCRSPSIIRMPILSLDHSGTNMSMERRVTGWDETSWDNSLTPQKNNQWGFPLTPVPAKWKSTHSLGLLLGVYFRWKKSPVSFLLPFLLRLRTF